MVQLDVVAGRQAGAAPTACRFPFVIGRNKDADLCLEEEGVWERHVEIDLRMPDGFVLKANPGPLATINGEPIRETVLRSGDLIEFGPVKLRFWLSPTRQLNLRWRESLTWFTLALMVAAQIALVYRWLP